MRRPNATQRQPKPKLKPKQPDPHEKKTDGNIKSEMPGTKAGVKGNPWQQHLKWCSEVYQAQKALEKEAEEKGTPRRRLTKKTAPSKEELAKALEELTEEKAMPRRRLTKKTAPTK